MTGASCTVSVNNSLEELVQVHAALEKFAEVCGVTAETRHATILVVEELFANAVRYGYDENEADTIVISARYQHGTMRVIIRDQARPFDVTAPPRRPDETLSLEEMEIGGLGLFLVHEFAQSITQDREGATNVTEIVLKNAEVN
ncbi:ATP-binding protein [Rhizobium terrae]|uniref:ATP-binding protein n=1 Tax=Rhizobium terrae TaxID=2171756 RepID=UPI0013C2ECB8|nr:ATP-binding protein [Rhizobium terrae]